MAYPRLIDDGNTVIITGNKSIKQTLTLEGGEKKNVWKSVPVTIASIPVTQPISSIEGLDTSKAAEVQAWLDLQMDQIAKAYQRNAANGVYGGQPVIKRYKTDHEKWGTHPNYIADRKSGEFLGMIKGAKQLGKTDSAPESNTGFVRKLRKQGRLAEMADDRIAEFLEMVHETNGKPSEALSREEGIDLYYVERKLQFLLQGLKVGVKSLPAEVKKQAEDDWKEFKQARLGYVLDKDRTVPELLAEFDSQA